MDLKRFRRDGGDLIVNMDRVHTVTARGDGRCSLVADDGEVIGTLTEGEIEDLVMEQKSTAEAARELAHSVSRLTQAVERLCVHIPTSIRMHM